MKAYNIISAILAVIGLILVYVGWNIGNGRFWGVAYYPGDYTTLYLGLVFLIGCVVLLTIPRIKTTHNQVEAKYENNRYRGFHIYTLLRFVAIITLIVGILQIISAFVKDNWPLLLYGIGCFVSYICMFGFSYIVEAACKYLARCKQEEIAAANEATEENSADL